MATVASPTAVARKKRRPIFWSAGFGLLLLLTPIGYALVSGCMAERELDALYREIDADDPHWRYADLALDFPAPPPDERNSAVRLLKVRDVLAKTPFSMPGAVGRRPKAVRNARLPEDEVKTIRAVFAKIPPGALDQARTLALLPDGRFRFEPLENPFDPNARFDVDIRLLPALNLLCLDVMLSAHDGDFEQAASSCLALIHAAHAMDDYPGLMAQLIRDAGLNHALQGIERTLAHGTIAATELTRLQAALEREADHNSLYVALRGERAWRQLSYELLCAGKISPDEVDGGKPGWSAGVSNLFSCTQADDHVNQLRLSHEMVKASRLPDEPRLLALEAVRSKASAHRNLKIQSAGFVAGNAVELHVTVAHLRCGIVAIAAERYRLQHGRLPLDAGELVQAGFLRAPLRDPFDGEPLRWTHAKTGVRIYSIGPPGSAEDCGFELARPEFRGRQSP